MPQGPLALDVGALSEGERQELQALGLLSETGELRPGVPSVVSPGHRPIRKRPMSAPQVLNEAFEYARPSSFSRGMRVDLPGVTFLFISGTASVDEQGRTIHKGDFRAQTWRTFRNITKLLESEGATWHDVVRTTCYLRDIERDYQDFNEVRTAFYRALGLNPLPASTAIQARICREDLLVEIEAIAMFETDR